MRHLWRYLLSAFLVVGLAGIYAGAQSDLAAYENGHYGNKSLFLRYFYQGKELKYGSNGELTKASRNGLWTVDGAVLVSKVSLSKNQLVIEADRLGIVGTDKGFTAKKTGERVHIIIATDPQQTTTAAIDAAMSKIFLGDQDNLLDSVPDYWKLCLSTAAANSSPEELGMCRLTSSIRIPLSSSAISASNTRLPTEPDQRSQYPRVIPGAGLVYRVGNDVIAPRALFSPNPEYSPAARAAGIQGSNKMMFVVDESGGVRNIEIIRPLGCGLDEKAVQAVQTWKFDPALKDGKPVSVLISIDVGFRFY